ncbi:MAG: Gluconate transporter [Pseudomonadota bacterium]|jgi:GntP family gluconate:H+ symporter
MQNPENLYLLLSVGASIVLLVMLVSVLRLHAFLALLVSALCLGGLAGMPAATLLGAVQKGAGDVLGFVGPVLALGAMLGQLLVVSGGADRLAAGLVGRFGPGRVRWAMLVVAFLAGVPLFFETGFALLVPLVFVVASRAGVAPLGPGIALLAGLSVLHGLLPPHPGPTLAVQAYGADMGKTLVYGLLVATPTAIVAGPLFGGWIAGLIPTTAASDGTATGLAAGHGPSSHGASERGDRAPPVAASLAAIILPVALILFGSAVTLSGAIGPLKELAGWLGHPIVALLFTVLTATYFLGARSGLSRQQVTGALDESLRPIATLLLIIGAGGAFKQVLISTGVGNVIGQLAIEYRASPLLLAWLVAGAVRIATGSATVAVITASGLMVPLLPLFPGVNRELLVLATGAGSLMLSHVNDAGFWMVKEYFRLSIAQTLKTWTVLETMVSVIALPLIIVLSLFV